MPKSSLLGLNLLINATFFARDHFFSWLSRASASRISRYARNKLAFCTDSQMRIQFEFPRSVPKFVVRDCLLRRYKEPTRCDWSRHKSKNCNHAASFGINSKRCLDSARNDKERLR